MRQTIVSFAALWLFIGSATAFAQLPLPPVPGKGEVSRLPDDQIEGTIWEYQGKLKDEPAKGEEVPELQGRFRTEGKAIFDVSRRLPIPEKKEVDKAVKALKKGELKDIKLPEGPQVKRLGEYRQITGGKLRLDFKDKESLNGIMIIWPKKETADVWLGNYTEKLEGKKVRTWIVEVRPIED